MIIYLDLVIISTIIVDICFLRLISIIWKEKIKIYRLIFGVFINIILILSFIFPFKDLIVLRYFMGLITILVVFELKSVKDYIIKVITYYILNILFIGLLTIFKIKNIYMLVISLLLVIILWVIENYKLITINEVVNIKHIKIGKHIYKAYIDTGNTIYYNGIPVVLIKYKHYNRMYKYIGSTKVVGITYTNIDIYEGPPIKCDNNEYIVYYSFNKNIHYDVILHRDCN